MTNTQLREFYELCQAYRHTPLDQFVQVSERYQALIDFVNGLIGERTRNDTYAPCARHDWVVYPDDANPEKHELCKICQHWIDKETQDETKETK